MTTFYVGQRVKIVDATRSKFLIGTETTVTALNVTAKGEHGPYVGTRTSAINMDGICFIAKEGWLEPIQYDGNKAVSWEECLWQPEHLRVAGAPEKLVPTI